jgi:hypothetical protein
MMNLLLWTLQILIGLHTIVGAVWNFSHSEQSVPSLKAIPHGAWLAMSVVELLCGAGLILPALSKSLAILAPRGGYHSHGNCWSLPLISLLTKSAYFVLSLTL